MTTAFFPHFVNIVFIYLYIYIFRLSINFVVELSDVPDITELSVSRISTLRYCLFLLMSRQLYSHHIHMYVNTMIKSAIYTN